MVVEKVDDEARGSCFHERQRSEGKQRSEGFTICFSTTIEVIFCHKSTFFAVFWISEFSTFLRRVKKSKDRVKKVIYAILF